jgi:homoserine kinase type II
MAVYTDITDVELAQFLRHYALGRVLSFKGIAEGVENSNYLLHADSGFFILTLYEKRVREADLPFFLGLMQHLSAHGLTCPQPVADRNGRLFIPLAGRPAAIVTFLDGLAVANPEPWHCGAVGEALAKLHRAGAGFPLERPNALSVAGWQGLAQAAHGRSDEVAVGLAGVIENELAFLAPRWPQRLPSGVIHADLFPDNVFFLGETLSGLIDFYFACVDAFAYDLAIGLNAWCFEADGSFNLDKGKAMLAGYRRIRPLTGAEVEALPLLARGSAVRFLLTRLVDWLNVPAGALVRPKDPLEYLRKLQFHQTVAAAQQYGLC